MQMLILIWRDMGRIMHWCFAFLQIFATLQNFLPLWAFSTEQDCIVIFLQKYSQDTVPEPSRGSLAGAVINQKKNKTRNIADHGNKQSMMVDHELAEPIFEFMREEEIERNTGLIFKCKTN